MVEPALKEKLRIFYIGGNPEIISLFQNAQNLFEIKTAENGLSAINQLKDLPFIDAIISEIVLPGANGLDVAKMLKLKGIHSSTTFIIVSGEKDTVNKKTAFEQRIDDFYDHDINPEDIYNRITFLKKHKDYLIRLDENVKPVREYKIPVEKRIFDILVSLLALLFLSPVYCSSCY